MMASVPVSCNPYDGFSASERLFLDNPTMVGTAKLVPAFVGTDRIDTTWSETMLLALRNLILHHIGIPRKTGVLDKSFQFFFKIFSPVMVLLLGVDVFDHSRAVFFCKSCCIILATPTVKQGVFVELFLHP